MHGTTTPVGNRQEAPRASASLFGFVGASLLLHLFILLNWPLPDMPHPEVSAPLSICLTEAKTAGGLTPEQATQPATHHTRPQPTRQRPQRTGSEAAPRATPRKPATPLAPLPTAQPASAAPAPAALPTPMTRTAQGPDEAAVRAALTVTLQQLLAEHFRYPLLARKRGWQGEVVLAFHVESDGRISNARIAHSSGYGLLDQAALNSLGKIGRLHQLPVFGVSLQLPIIYQLEG